jgi:hypothetical protein
LVDTGIGTEIVVLKRMKLKLSYKDFLLLLGILVAVIITLTTLVYKESLPEATQITPIPKKSSMNTTPSVVVKKLLRKVELSSFLPR